MYRTSTDRRFLKNKMVIRQAFIDLVMEKGLSQISVSALARQANINRMTFYAHYDIVEDVFDEFIADMEADLHEQLTEAEELDLSAVFHALSQTMFQEIDFFRFIAKDDNCAEFHLVFRQAIKRILIQHGKRQEKTDSLAEHVKHDLLATGIAYLYLDWLAGEYGDVDIQEIIDIAQELTLSISI